MREMLQLGVVQRTNGKKIFSGNTCPWFVATIDSDSPIPVQDTVHEGAKMRTRLLKDDKPMPFGNFIACRENLETLCGLVTKDKHLLQERDLLPEDKMNYDAVGRLSRPEIRVLLKQHVAGSEGTVFYLKLMEYTTTSFLDKQLTPLQCIYRIWFAVFSTRYWRYWMTCDKTYPLAKHFFTANAYQCLELNAHLLVLTELRLQKLKLTELFLPWSFGSQQCESYFKALRSFTPMGSTQTNFTVGEVITSRGWKVKITCFVRFLLLK